MLAGECVGGGGFAMYLFTFLCRGLGTINKHNSPSIQSVNDCFLLCQCNARKEGECTREKGVHIYIFPFLK